MEKGDREFQFEGPDRAKAHKPERREGDGCARVGGASFPVGAFAYLGCKAGEQTWLPSGNGTCSFDFKPQGVRRLGVLDGSAVESQRSLAGGQEEGGALRLERGQCGHFRWTLPRPFHPLLYAGVLDPQKAQLSGLARQTLKRELCPHKQKVEVGC